jgi:hypothetical protein
MKTKIFEIRDYGMHIPMLCIKMVLEADDCNKNSAVLQWILYDRCGYSQPSDDTLPLIMMTPLNGGGLAHVDPYGWGDRTLQEAHHHIRTFFDELPNGSLIDVRVILGEEWEPVKSNSAFSL